MAVLCTVCGKLVDESEAATHPCCQEKAVDDSGWLPIESAPRDGTEILVWTPDKSPADGAMVAFFVARSDGSATWTLGKRGDFWLNITQVLTHWQPLPLPPSHPSRSKPPNEQE
jgi:hypothetical protein